MGMMADDSAVALAERVAAVRRMVAENQQRLADTSIRLQATMRKIDACRPQHDRLHDVAVARLRARLETMPVIEQAKGILMAQCCCGPEEAFDMLRRASQRTNVRVRDLAADIVRRTAEQEAGSPKPGALPARAARPVPRVRGTRPVRSPRNARGTDRVR